MAGEARHDRREAPGTLPKPRYAELRCRSCFSFLAGASHPEELVSRAAELGLSALALADLNGLYGIVRAHAEARRRGLPLVVGAEIAVAGLGLGRAAPLVLLAQDREGYANLCRLVTLAHGGETAPAHRGDGRSEGDEPGAGAPLRRDAEDVRLVADQVAARARGLFSRSIRARTRPQRRGCARRSGRGSRSRSRATASRARRRAIARRARSRTGSA
jgi:hypothetical protein